MGIPHILPFPQPDYPTIVAIDRDSHGDGLYQYGDDGFVLLGFVENGHDLIQLPNYISNVTIHRHGWKGWSNLQRSFLGSSENDRSYLPNPAPNKSKARALGMIGHADQKGTL